MIHSYQCQECQITEERIVKMSEMEEQQCQVCGQEMKRLLPLIANMKTQWATSAGTYYPKATPQRKRDANKKS